MIGYHIEHRNDVYDKRTLYKLLTGFVIGDGGLWVSKANRENGNAQYHTSRLWKNIDYVLWQAKVLSQVTKVYIRQQPESGMHKLSVRMCTMRNPFYTVLYERLYGIGRKSLTHHDLLDFDAVSLACLIQDDGSINKPAVGTHYRMIICTDSFSEPECKLLRDVIAKNLNIHGDVIRYKNTYRLRYKKDQTDRMIDAIQPYMAPSYYYKIMQTPSLETVASWYIKIDGQDDGIVRTLLKDSDLYRNVID